MGGNFCLQAAQCGDELGVVGKGHAWDEGFLFHSGIGNLFHIGRYGRKDFFFQHLFQCLAFDMDGL